MKKLKKLWPLFLSLTVVVFLIILIFSQPKVILFYGNTCPHCEKVDEYLKANPSKIKYRHLEVYDNQQNAVLMSSKAKACGIDDKNIGVPFLYDGKNCLIGEPDITNWFSNR
ncbi:MAG: hypothetical protein ACOYMB_04580 [Patescibacteria group bacterium]